MMEIEKKALYSFVYIIMFGAVGLVEEGNKRGKINEEDVFLDCLRELRVPLDIYLELGPRSLSESEKEKLKVCRQISCGEVLVINSELFDIETLHKITNYLSKVGWNNAKD